jgi:acetyl esterase/lipase
MASQAMLDVMAKMRAWRERGGDPAHADYGSPDYPARRAAMDASAPPAPEDCTVEPTDADGLYAEWVRAPGADAKRRLLYLYGGAYLTGSPKYRHRLASDISRASGCSVLLPRYRLAPEHPFPAAIEDAMTAYRWMRGHGPEGASDAASLFVAGDSAGGGLTLAVLLSLRDAREPQPTAAITLSPWTDLAVTGESLVTRGEEDPTNVGRDAVVSMANDYLAGADPKHPLASPVYADLHGLPPLLMQVGDYEVLLSDTTRVAERARAAGVDVTLDIEPEAFHAYQSLAAVIPEAQAAVDRIGAFIRKHG